ncbi:MAG: hypothetical protein ABSE73_01785 [Planctomycetota bacterium]
MESKYDQEDWKIILKTYAEVGCNASETLLVVRAKYPQYAHLAWKTFKEYLRSEEGEKQVAEALEAHELQIAGQLAINRTRWNAMSLYRLWEECARALLMRALAGDRDAERKAVQYLRLASPMLKAAQFDRFLEEEDPEPRILGPVPEDLVAQAVQPRSTSVPASVPPSPLAPNPSPLARPSNTAALASVLACASLCAPANPAPKPAPRAPASAVSEPRASASGQSTNPGPERLLATDEHR